MPDVIAFVFKLDLLGRKRCGCLADITEGIAENIAV